MAKSIINQNKYSKIISLKSLLCILIIYLMCCLLINPAEYIQSANEGIMLWVNHLLPALFPFFILTKLLMGMNILEKITFWTTPIMNKLFKTGKSSGYLFLISIMSGYPVGSKLVADAYQLGKIDQTELHRLVTFTSVSGPLFIVGTVGVNMLTSSKIGYILLFSHIISAILNGMFYRNYVPINKTNLITETQANKNQNLLTSSVKSSIDSILLIGGLVCIFYVGMDAINNITTLPATLQGIIEITKGCYELSINLIDVKIKTILLSTIITFGGFCTHSQSMFFLKECGISYKFFFKQKVTQTIFATITCSILCFILL